MDGLFIPWGGGGGGAVVLLWGRLGGGGGGEFIGWGVPPGLIPDMVLKVSVQAMLSAQLLTMWSLCYSYMQ